MASAMLERAVTRSIAFSATLPPWSVHYKARRDLLQGRKLPNEIQRQAAATEFKAQAATNANPCPIPDASEKFAPPRGVEPRGLDIGAGRSRGVVLVGAWFSHSWLGGLLGLTTNPKAKRKSTRYCA